MSADRGRHDQSLRVGQGVLVTGCRGDVNPVVLDHVQDVKAPVSVVLGGTVALDDHSTHLEKHFRQGAEEFLVPAVALAQRPRRLDEVAPDSIPSTVGARLSKACPRWIGRCLPSTSRRSQS
jgi:hypothetical protein